MCLRKMREVLERAAKEIEELVEASGAAAGRRRPPGVHSRDGSRLTARDPFFASCAGSCIVRPCPSSLRNPSGAEPTQPLPPIPPRRVRPDGERADARAPEQRSVSRPSAEASCAAAPHRHRPEEHPDRQAARRPHPHRARRRLRRHRHEPALRDQGVRSSRSTGSRRRRRTSTACCR